VQFVANEIEMFARHISMTRRFIRVLVEDVPRTEDDVGERREAEKGADARRSGFGAYAEADRAELRERSDRLGQAAARQENAGHHRRGNGAQTGREHS
jgi:hypothetical protein